MVPRRVKTPSSVKRVFYVQGKKKGGATKATAFKRALSKRGDQVYFLAALEGFPTPKEKTW